MKKLISVFAVMALLMGLTVCAGASGYVTFSSQCNVRLGPGLGYDILGAVIPGDTLDYAGGCINDDRGMTWYSVYYKNTTGWVSSKYAMCHDSDSDDDGGDDYSDGEPYVPLAIQSNARGEWKYYNNDILGMRIKVTNVSKTWTIKAFQIYMYAEDMWGERIYGDDYVYYNTTNKRVAPGETVFCDYIKLPQRSRIVKVHAGVKKVIFTDGTIRENDTVEYWNWTIS